MKKPESVKTLITLGNATELVRTISQGVLGNEVADTFDGSPLTRAVIYNMVQTEFQAALAKHLGN